MKRALVAFFAAAILLFTSHANARSSVYQASNLSGRGSFQWQGFSPTWIPSCKFWLDPSRGFVASTSWKDQISGITFTYNSSAGSTAVASNVFGGRPSITLTLGGYFSTATTIASLVSVGAWTSLSVFQYTGAVVDTSAYLLPSTVMDSGSFWQGGAVSTTKFRAGQYNGGPYVSDPQTITTSTNYFALGLFDGSKVHTSLNGGALSAGVSVANVASTAGTIVVAGDYNHAIFYVGSIGDVVVCNTALTAAQQAQLNTWASVRAGK